MAFASLLCIRSFRPVGVNAVSRIVTRHDRIYFCQLTRSLFNGLIKSAVDVFISCEQNHTCKYAGVTFENALISCRHELVTRSALLYHIS